MVKACLTLSKPEENFCRLIEIILSQCFIWGYNVSTTRNLSIEILRLHWPMMRETGSYSVSLACRLSTSSILALDIVRPITDKYSRIELKSRRTWHFMCGTSHVTHYETKAVIRISVHPSCMALTKIWKRNKAGWIREFFRQKLDQGVK